MTKDEIIKIAEQSGWFVLDTKIYSPHPIGEYDELNEYIYDLVKISIAHERSIISETFWAAVNDCITTDELGVEFMSKFYQVHEFGHWLDGENK